MKTNGMISVVALFLALGFTGCGEKAAEAPPVAAAPVPPPPPPAPKPVEPAKPQAAAPSIIASPVVAAPVTLAPVQPKPPETPKAVAQEAAKVAQQFAVDAGATAQKQFTDLVTDVKQLVADGKTAEAITRLQTAISSLKLSADQQRIVDSLKKQAQDAVTQKGVDAATKVVGDLFKPKAPAPPQ